MTAGNGQQEARVPLSLVSTLFAVNAVTVIACQVLVPGVIRRSGGVLTFATGTTLCAAGVLGAGLSTDVLGLVGAVLVFSVGESLALPALDVVVSDAAPQRMLGSYFGASSLAWAVGGFVGGSVGGWLLGTAAASVLPWAALAAVGFSTAIALVMWSPAWPPKTASKGDAE